MESEGGELIGTQISGNTSSPNAPAHSSVAASDSSNSPVPATGSDSTPFSPSSGATPASTSRNPKMNAGVASIANQRSGRSANDVTVFTINRSSKTR